MKDFLQIALVLLASSFSLVVASFLTKVTDRSKRWKGIRLVHVPVYSRLQKFTMTNSRSFLNDNSSKK